MRSVIIFFFCITFVAVQAMPANDDAKDPQEHIKEQQECLSKVPWADPVIKESIAACREKQLDFQTCLKQIPAFADCFKNKTK